MTIKYFYCFGGTNLTHWVRQQPDGQAWAVRNMIYEWRGQRAANDPDVLIVYEPGEHRPFRVFEEDLIPLREVPALWQDGQSALVS